MVTVSVMMAMSMVIFCATAGIFVYLLSHFVYQDQFVFPNEKYDNPADTLIQGLTCLNKGRTCYTLEIESSLLKDEINIPRRSRGFCICGHSPSLPAPTNVALTTLSLAFPQHSIQSVIKRKRVFYPVSF